MEDRSRLRPSGVKGEGRADVASAPVGDRTSSGACIMLRGIDLGLHAEAKGICGNSSGTILESANPVRWLTTFFVNLPHLQSTQSGDGREGDEENEGIGIAPGKSIKRSAHWYPAWIWSTSGASINCGTGMSGMKSGRPFRLGGKRREPSEPRGGAYMGEGSDVPSIRGADR